MLRQFRRDWKSFGLSVAWFNVKFTLCKRWLGVKRMTVTFK